MLANSIVPRQMSHYVVSDRGLCTPNRALFLYELTIIPSIFLS